VVVASRTFSLSWGTGVVVFVGGVGVVHPAKRTAIRMTAVMVKRKYLLVDVFMELTGLLFNQPHMKISIY
jgi:hypothetical protein